MRIKAPKQRFAVGDLVKCLRPHAQGIVREILAVRRTGYTWRYPEVPDKDFWSENSNDPFLELGWVKQ